MNVIARSEGPRQSLEKFWYKLSEVDSPVSPDVATAILQILVRILVILKLLYEVSVSLDEEVSVTATDPKELRFLAEVCSKLLVEVLIHR